MDAVSKDLKTLKLNYKYFVSRLETRYQDLRVKLETWTLSLETLELRSKSWNRGRSQKLTSKSQDLALHFDKFNLGSVYQFCVWLCLTLSEYIWAHLTFFMYNTLGQHNFYDLCHVRLFSFYEKNYCRLSCSGNRMWPLALRLIVRVKYGVSHSTRVLNNSIVNTLIY